MSRVLTLLDQAKEKVKAAKVRPARASIAGGILPHVKSLSIMGSTGSIGVNTLRIVRAHPKRFCVKALAARRNIDLLEEQAREFRPKMICVFDGEKALDLERRLRRMDIVVVTGREGLIEAATHPSADEVIFAMAGVLGLSPIFSALNAGKVVAVANKEPLVMAGGLLMKEAGRCHVPVIPIDSEHSGLWQCLHGQPRQAVKKLILTSSGGPFRKWKGSMDGITPREALRHPKWKMGQKITIDSATMMNKGLEVIEASNLFGIAAERIEVLIHPEAVVHAMVEFVDGTHLANLAVTDMRVPIQYAMSFPDRINNHLPRLDFSKIRSLHFEKPDIKRFPCLALAYEAARVGGTMPAVLNAANEVAVDAFLTRQISFPDIARKIERVMAKHRVAPYFTLKTVLEADRWAREEAGALIPYKGRRVKQPSAA